MHTIHTAICGQHEITANREEINPLRRGNEITGRNVLPVNNKSTNLA